MSLRPGTRRLHWLGEPFRVITDRVTLGALAACGIGLLVLTKLDLQVITVVSERAGDLAAPVLRLVNQPVLLARQAADRAGRLLALEAENERLREENRRLLAWQAEAARLGAENQALREMLRVPSLPRMSLWVTAQIVADTGGSFVQSRLIDAGTNRGVEPGMPVLTEEGLVGRVIAAGRNSSRVLLITDFTSRIPVAVGDEQSRAILRGNNGPLPTLEFLPSTARPRVGDRVLTSGEGGLLQSGLLVGEVASVENATMVRPLVDWARLDWVAVLRSEPVEPPDASTSDVVRSHRYGGPR